VDPDQLNVTVLSPYSFSSVTERIAQGIYVVHIASPLVSGMGWYPIVAFNATMGDLNATRSLRVYWGPGPEPSVDRWNVRAFGVEPFGASAAPWWYGRRQVTAGQLVTIRASITLNGTLADPGSVTATLECFDGFSFLAQGEGPAVPLATTRMGVGSYQTSLVAQGAANVTRECRVHMTATNPTARGASSIGSSVSFEVVPFPVLVWQRAAGPMNQTWAVLVGAGAPIVGAEVTLRGSFEAPYPPGANTTSVPVFDAAATDENGWAEVQFELNGSGMLDMWINVTADGATASVSLYVNSEFSGVEPNEFAEDPASNGTFDAAFKSPWPGAVPYLGWANYTMRATSNGTALPNETIFLYPLVHGAGPFPPLRVVTDESGTFSFPIQLNTSLWSGFHVLIVDSGRGEDTATARAPTFATPFPWLEYLQTLPTDLEARATGNRTSLGALVTAHYVGNHTLVGVAGWATLLPLSEDSWCGANHGAIPVGPLYPTAQTGEFEGRVTLPAWYPEGDYCVVASVGSESWAATNYSVVHLGPAVPDPDAPPASPPPPQTTPFAAFFDAGPWIVAILVLGAVMVAAAMRLRMRRRDDEAP
jgi:hypothetical protein